MTTEQKFNCIFCKDVFGNKEDLQDHFRKHGDPKYKNKTRFDTQISNEISKEKTEMVSCDVCSQVFTTISKAITHKHKVHPDHDAKYFCPWCGKLFTMKHLYNVHVQSNHSNQEQSEDKCFTCDSCSVDFFIPSAMIYHNKFFHRQDTDIPDVGQSKKFKLYNQEVMQIYYCAFCGEEYDNKVNLFKHMTDDHSDENQSPDEVLKCPLCEAVFYHLDAYELHLTFHTPDDMFSIKNDLFSELVDYSLETVPPMIEKVENLDIDGPNQDDAESTINAVGIEKFLELAMDQSDETSPVKVKKHKKHKKSKKSAITLDEFLSMNQDVFGEGLDFQGIEEVPTRVVKKQLKSNKKPTNVTNNVTLSDLEKLKKAGIVIKKKVGRPQIVKHLKLPSRPTKSIQNKKFTKIKPEREIKTSSEVLTKLLNQSNNQIKIVKKSSTDSARDSDSAVHDPNDIQNDVSVEEDEPPCENTNVEHSEADNYECNVTQTKIASTPESNSLHDKDIANEPSSPNSKESPNETLDEPSPKELDESSTITNVSKQATKFVPPNNDEKSHDLSQDAKFCQVSKQDDKSNSETVTKPNEEADENEPEHHISDNELDKEDGLLDSINHDEKDEHTDENEVTSDNNTKHPNMNNSTGTSLSTLKHLSHLITVKPVSQNKITTPVEQKKTIVETKDEQTPQTTSQKITPHTGTSTEKTCSVKPKTVEKDPTLDALKNLCKNITVKSLSAKRIIENSECEMFSNFDEEENSSYQKVKDPCTNKNITFKKIKIETSEPMDNKVVNYLNTADKISPRGKQSNILPAVGMKPGKIIVKNEDNSAQTTNANILKRLKNITTKSVINNRKNCQPAVRQTNIAKKIVQSEEEKDEIIEIFDVDDSEDELENSSNKIETSQNSTQSLDALKNLSKNITIKSNKQPILKNIKLENNRKVEKQNEDSFSNYKDDSNVETLINIQNRNMAHVLMGLGKNITIKSGNSSPNRPIQSPDHDAHDPKVDNNEASDSDSCPGNIKITEIDQDASDNDSNLEHSNHDNPIVETPNDSCSDMEDMDDFERDFEAEIKSSTVQKFNQSVNSTQTSMTLTNLKNIGKNITIKSLSSSTTDKEDISEQHDNSEPPPSRQIKQLPSKSSNQTREFKNENISMRRHVKDFGQNADTSPHSLKQKISAMNQVNTINKEVTVKTIQTNTVIQEITTTVTKTIKTVNQTVKQEVCNTSQTNTPIINQKVMGIRPSQPRNLRGVVVRHAAPNAVSSSLSQIRPAIVRPSKQVLHQVRPAISKALVRADIPRMAVGKKIAPSPSTSNLMIGRPLKISPSAMTSSMIKRPNTEDLSGPFSCFKKPKESLIPVSDIPSFTNSSDATVFTAASHTTSSNITSTTKINKGKNSVVNAKQVKSQVNATTQQLSRLSNTAGLKITSSQAKQSQVQENCESSPMKRTTLEAIQRLQQQGLLVKKPRTDINEGSGHSNHDDDNVGYDSAEEPDE